MQTSRDSCYEDRATASKKEAARLSQLLSVKASFNCNGFCQISRFIHIASTGKSCIVSKELQGVDGEDRRQFLICSWDGNHAVGVLCQLRITIHANADDDSTAALDFLQVADGLFVDMRLGSKNNNRYPLLNQGKGPVL